MNKEKGKEHAPLMKEEEIASYIGTLRKEGQLSVAEKASAYQLALLLEIRNLLVRLVKDFEDSLVA